MDEPVEQTSCRADLEQHKRPDHGCCSYPGMNGESRKALPLPGPGRPLPIVLLESGTKHQRQTDSPARRRNLAGHRRARRPRLPRRSARRRDPRRPRPLAAYASGLAAVASTFYDEEVKRFLCPGRSPAPLRRDQTPIEQRPLFRAASPFPATVSRDGEAGARAAPRRRRGASPSGSRATSSTSPRVSPPVPLRSARPARRAVRGQRARRAPGGRGGWRPSPAPARSLSLRGRPPPRKKTTPQPVLAPLAVDGEADARLRRGRRRALELPRMERDAGSTGSPLTSSVVRCGGPMRAGRRVPRCCQLPKGRPTARSKARRRTIGRATSAPTIAPAATSYAGCRHAAGPVQAGDPV